MTITGSLSADIYLRIMIVRDWWALNQEEHFVLDRLDGMNDVKNQKPFTATGSVADFDAGDEDG